MDVTGSPSPRHQSFLSGFIPRRARSSSVPPPPDPPLDFESSPSNNRRRAALPSPHAPTATPSNTTSAGGSANHFPGSHFPVVSSATGLSAILRRTRRDSTGPPPVNSDTSPCTRPSNNMPAVETATPSPPAAAQSPPGQAHRIRLVPHLESTRSLPFEPIIRDPIEGGSVLKVGRFTDRQVPAASSANASNSLKIAFKSKVVSRGHAELWVEAGGKFFIKDTSSSSGTFLNHVRLSAPGATSRPFAIKDGDVIQLGVDYQGGQQEIYRCVKIKVEVGRGWQSAANAFNTNALRQLSGLGVSNVAPSKLIAGPNGHTTDVAVPDKSAAITPACTSGTDCCICLFPVTVCQALFIAPCSHAFHYKCMRPMLVMHHPGFSCPLCRTFADLESDVEVEAIPEPVQLSAPAITAGADGTGRPAVVLEDGAGEDLAMRDDEHEQHEQQLGDITHAEEGSAEGFGEEEVEAMVTSENEREERARGARSGSGSGSGSGTRQSSRARGEDEHLHPDGDHSDEEDELEDDGEDLGLNGEGADLATASTPLNGTFLSLVRQNIHPSSSAHSLPPPPNVSTPNSTAEEFEDASSDMDLVSGGEGIAIGSGAVAIPAGPSTRSRTASRLGGVVGKRKR